MREPVITAVFSDVALAMSCGSTSSVTRPRRAGFSKALRTPRTSVSAQTTGDVAQPARSTSAEDERLHREQRLGDDRHRALVAAVGDGAGPRPEHQHRQELQGDGDPEVGRPARQVVDEQRHRRQLQPRADVRDQQPGEEDAGVAVAQARNVRQGVPAATCRDPTAGPVAAEASVVQPSS